MKAQVENEEKPALDRSSLWDAIQHYGKALMFIRGMRSQSVVTDDDETELRKRASSVRVEHMKDAGHSVQGDMPLELAELIRDFAL
jgi:pimeloyl-ACP methyl ester carboxylesterase